MESQPTPKNPSSKPMLLAILGLPVLAVIVIIGFGVLRQWDQITPRWQDKKAPPAAAPADPTQATNQPAAKPPQE